MFIKKAEKIHGNKYDYSSVNYINARIKVSIICSEHGVFVQIPSSHLSGNGCPECGKIKIAETKKLNLIEFITRVSLIHWRT
jgi:hypothetical protein